MQRSREQWPKTDLPSPGEPHFAPLLVKHVHASLEPTWSFDPSLFSTLLLALIVRQGGVIVDVLQGSGDRREEVGRVVGAVRGLTEGVFGRETHAAHLRRGSTPDDMPYKLLLDPPSRAREFLRNDPSGSGSRLLSALSSPMKERSGRSTAVHTPGTTPKPNMQLNSPMETGTASHGFSRLGSKINTGESQTRESPRTRVPEVLIISGVEWCGSPVWVKLCDMLVKRKVRLGGDGYPRGESDENSEDRSDGDCTGRQWDLGGCLVIWVRDEEGSERCPSWLIDQFACSIVVHPDDIEPSLPLPRQSIISPDYIDTLHSLLSYTHIHPPLQIHISNLLSAVSNHPRLRSTITGRAVTCLPNFVRAHRLLSAPFDLPRGWEEALRMRRIAVEEGSGGRLGLGGGKGGVDTWAQLAGEEPSVLDLRKDDDAGGDDWYAVPENMEGVFMLALRHRVSWRGERGEVMWLLKGDSAGLFKEDKGTEGRGANDVKPGRGRASRRRRGVDMIMEEILQVV